MNFVNWWGSLKNKFVYSDHSFTRFAAARWQDSMSRGQKSSHIDFLFILDNVGIIVNKICLCKKGGVTERPRSLNPGKAAARAICPIICLFYYLARALIYDVA